MASVSREVKEGPQKQGIDEEIAFQELIERAVQDYLKKPLQKGGKGARK